MNRVTLPIRSLCAFFSVLLALSPLAAWPQKACAAPGDITRCSTDKDGNQTTGGGTFNPSISSDGRYVAFCSYADNLVPGDTNARADVFRKDLQTGAIARCSTDASENQAMGGHSYSPSISSDGRYVAFRSYANNLVPGDTNGTYDIFRKDLQTGAITRCSTDKDGNQATGGDSSSPSISADGRYVAFDSKAANLVPGDTNGTWDVFRKDLQTGAITRCSTDKDGNQATGGDSGSPSISADGRYVAFASHATTLVPGDTNAAPDIFRKDLQTGAIARCSTDKDGNQATGGDSGSPTISADGRYVAFHSCATDLVPGDTNGTWDIFRKDLQTGAITRCSTDKDGNQATGGDSFNPSISSDDRYVVFQSHATNLVPGDTNARADVFRKDLQTGAITRCSTDKDGKQATGGDSESPSISADGRYVAFESGATNLVPGDTNGIWDVFRKELSAPTTFFFAEGYTGAGFQEYLCLGQPADAPLEVRVTYLFRDGSPPVTEAYEVPGRSRYTVDVNAVVGEGREVSIVCEADEPFVAERPMYFDYGGEWTGGHDAVGADSPSDLWYFAEGYTGAGFQEWVCVLNPGDTDASLTFRFQTQEEGEKVVSGLSVPAHSRGSFLANDLLGGGSYQTSLALESSVPVVAERPIYFDYTGTGNWHWTGGHCVLGTPSLSTQYFFAEGCTREGFEEWLTLQNPGDDPITVHAVYNLGEGEPVERDYAVPARKRYTVLVNDPVAGVGPGQDVSVRLTSSSPFLAERPMYFDYQGTNAWGWTGGHCVIGTASPAQTWFFAEGYTGAGFEEWICVQNPSGDDARVSITYYPQGGTPIAPEAFTVPANSRHTVFVNKHAGADLQISAEVSSDVPIICERPMYFSYGPGGWTGGHDVVGYAP